MPEIKNTFLGGKMNKDLDERLIPKNEYRDALNVEVSTSQGDDVGSLQNTFGNTAQSDLSSIIAGGKCIGSIVDKENDKIYWFIKGDNVDAIAEYDAKLRRVSPVVVDFGMPDTYVQTFSSLDVNPSSGEFNVRDVDAGAWTSGSAVTGAEGISWSISGGSATAIYGRVGVLDLYINEVNLVGGYRYELEYDITVAANSGAELYIANNTPMITVDTESSGSKKIQWVQGADVNKLSLYQDSHNEAVNGFSIDNIKIKQVNRFLNFDSVDNITGINILDGMLFWTDGENEPKKINIERCKSGSYGVANFGQTSVIGAELVVNGGFFTDTNWDYSATYFEISDGVVRVIADVPQYYKIEQTNVAIKRGKTYSISVELGGSFTQGSLGLVIVDELGGFTYANTSYASSVGTYTWVLTSGVTDQNTTSNHDANFTISSIYLQNAGSLPILTGLTIDNVSVSEVAFDWNRTTRLKDASGAYSRDMLEEDITLIKKYPINAPSMTLIDTTKPGGSITKTSCTTPQHTTFDYNDLYASGSGDTIRYKNFTHLYLRSDAYIYKKNLQFETKDGDSQLIQLDVGPDWSSLDSNSSGSNISYPLYQLEENPWSVETSLGANEFVTNKFTTQQDYHKEAWQAWVSIDHHTTHHVWCIDESGDYQGVPAATAWIDKMGGRVWITSIKSSGYYDPALWRKGQRITIGHWNWNNNKSFWTYQDGLGNTLVKPAGTKTGISRLPDGQVMRDEYGGNVLSPTLLNPADKYADELEDFGAGWSVVNNKYVGALAQTTVDQAHPLHSHGLNHTVAVGTGYQMVHNFVKGLKKGQSYILYMQVNIIEDGSGAATEYTHPFGISEWDVKTDKSIIIPKTIHGNSSDVLSGVYSVQHIFTVNNNADTPTTCALSFWKRDGVSIEISGISIDHKVSNPIQIHPLVFSPKPDYEAGDLIKMTNSNKAPNGDDVNITVKLIEEIESGSNLYKDIHAIPATDEWLNSSLNNFEAPESWQDDVTIGTTNLIEDFNFWHDDIVVTPINSFASGGDLNIDNSNKADWTTSLEMIENGAFTGNSNSWIDQGPDNAYLNYNSYGFMNNISLIGDATGGYDFPFIYQSQTENPRIFWEKNGLYNFSLDHGDLTLGANGGGIYMRPENSTYYGQVNTNGSLFNDGFVSASNASGTTISAGTISGEVGWDHSIMVDSNNAIAAIPNSLRIFGIVNTNASGSIVRNTAGTVDNISVLANQNINRVSWGGSSGVEVVTGTTSQIISYPANASGVKAVDDGTGAVSAINTLGDFSLTEGSYYKLTYEIQTSNYTGPDMTSGCFISLFDCEKWDNVTTSAASNAPIKQGSGNIILDASVGTHDLFWKQGKQATQLHLCFGPGFAGELKYIWAYEVDFDTIDYGPNGSNEDRKVFNTEIVSIDSNLTQLPLEQHNFWNCELVDEDPLFAKVFPRFAYRWKYQDGEYSALSAFTEVAFLPNNTYSYDARDGYNLSMENTVRRVVLDNFDTKPSGVTELDILYKESNSNNIYTFKTIKGAGLSSFEKFEITKEKFHSLIDSKQILRPYDNVPRKAKAQELSANRIIFGNYTQQYDVTPSDEPIITTTLSTAAIESSEQAVKSIKSIRDYQVGVSYLDAYGRQSPVFSSDDALLRIGQKNSKTANTINAKLDNYPPSWVTHYKYYVKDSSSSYHNISLDRFYQAESGDHVWLSFPSSDFNKVKIDDYLVLKKQHNSNDAVAPDLPVKYKVLAVKGNAPEFIKMTRKNIGGKVFNDDGTGLHFYSQASYGGSANGYPQKDKITFRLKGNIVFNNKALLEAFMDDQTGRYIRIGRSIANKPSLFSNYYEILHISRVSINDADWEDAEDYYEVTLVQPLGFDASFVGSQYNTNVQLFLEYYREELDQFDNSFEGKFFVKIAKDASFGRFIGSKQKAQDTGFNIVNAQDTHWCRQYENSANAATNKGQDTDAWLKVRSLTATNTGEINSLFDGNIDWTPSSDDAAWTANTASVYNATQVTNFPALNDVAVTINSNSVTNPFTANWKGTVLEADFKYTDLDSVPQRFFIDQTIRWGWSRGWKSYEGENTIRSYSPMGNGFVMGNDYCSFSFIGLGDIDLGTDGAIGSSGSIEATPDPSSSDIDTNTWFDGANAEKSAQWFDNFLLVQQLSTVGTQFRWHDDPTHTVYTVKKVLESRKRYTHDRQLPNGDDYGTSPGGKILNKGPENFGWSLDIQLDVPIKWSPTATIASGLGLNAGGDHTPLVPLENGVVASLTSTSQIQVLEKRASELTHTSFNPAVFEVEPKERADLNLYYETPKAGMVLKDGMSIEALNSTSVNDGDSGLGNYNSEIDVGTIYKPSGLAALPYAKGYGFDLIPYPPQNGMSQGYSKRDWDSTAVAPFNAFPWQPLSYQQNSNNFLAGFGTKTHIYTITNTYIPLSQWYTNTQDQYFHAGERPMFESPTIDLVDGVTYEFTVDVDSIDNDVNNTGTFTYYQNQNVDYGDGLVSSWQLSPEDTYMYFKALDVNGDYDVQANTTTEVPLVVGLNTFEFTYDKALFGGSLKGRLVIELRDKMVVDAPFDSSPYDIRRTSYYGKEITLNSTRFREVTIDESVPGQKIRTGSKYGLNDPNSLWIDQNNWSNVAIPGIDLGQDLPSGITVRISERDDAGKMRYYKDYVLDDGVFCDGSKSVFSLPVQPLSWHNCFSFGNGVESNRLRDDFNAVTIDKGPRVSTTLEETYKEEKKSSGLIFSGIYNSTSSVNQLNQFIQAESITKDLNPEYGSIQKLFTRNTNIVALCENKILKVLANKDALFNADGSSQVTSSSKVLGQAIPFIGEYGISRNPESFANFGYRVYFTDRDRGAVLRLSADGLTPISDKDMISYFKANLPNSNTIVGSYDEDRDAYNVSLADETVSFSENVNGWTSFKSFSAQSGASLNGEYYTFRNSDIWKHSSNALRNNFYNTQYESSVKFVFNDIVDEVKNFNTLNYEGSRSRKYESQNGQENQLINSGWYTSHVKTDLESAEVVNFVEKEGKWFNSITGLSKTEVDVDIKDFTSQGLGLSAAINSNGHPAYKTMEITAVSPESVPDVNAIGAGSGVLNSTNAVVPYPTSPIITHTEDIGYNSLTGWEVQSPSQVRCTTHSGNGDANDDPDSYYLTGVIRGLQNGNRYRVDADVEDYSLSSTGVVGFSGIHAINIDTNSIKTISSNGKIHMVFTYNSNKFELSTGVFGGLGDGIHLSKQRETAATIKNIRCTNITPRSDEQTYKVNTSATDKTQSIVSVKENFESNTNPSVVVKNFYVHANTVSGVKYAVSANKFEVTSSNNKVEVTSKQDMGSGTNSAGYHGNVIEITITINYSSGNMFPENNVESFISVSGSPTLAIDN